MYTKLKPLDSDAEMKRAQSSPGIAMARLNQSTVRSRDLAEETMRKIEQFEISLRKTPNLPAIGLALSGSSNTMSEKPTTKIVSTGEKLAMFLVMGLLFCTAFP